MLSNFKIHHIGYAVKNIEKAAKLYRGMGFEVGEIVKDPIQNCLICFLWQPLSCGGSETMIELVAPLDEKSPVVTILQKNGNSPYHICYEVDNMEEALKELKPYRFVKLFNPLPAVAMAGRKICYLFNRDNGLIELVER